jgi:hypothetical protein
LNKLPKAPQEIILSHQKTNIFLHDNLGKLPGRPIIVKDSNQMSSIDMTDQCLPVQPTWTVTSKSKYSQTRFWKEYTKYFVGEDKEDELQIIKTQLVEYKYKPLKERTKTLADLRTTDTTEYKEMVQPYIEKYRARRKNIHEQRLKEKEYTAYYDLDLD